MHFTFDPPADGPTNMALDCCLLKTAEAGGMVQARVYSWSAPWITLGRFQDPLRDLLPGCPVPWVMRPTGGRAVLHGHDVTVAIAGPALDGPRSVRLAYRRYVQPLIESLRLCGVPAALGEQTSFSSSKSRGADCFEHVAANDVVDERTGRKVCGCALRLTDSAVLVQASIPVGPPLIDPSLVFAEPAVSSFSPIKPQEFAEFLHKSLPFLSEATESRTNRLP